MAKPPSWNEIRRRAAAFAARWADETDENASAQTFWNEFLAIFGVDRKRVATFEARAQRTSTGGRGRIDLLWPGTLAAEHKSAGKSLDVAESQALDYLDSLTDESLPGVILTSDFVHVRIRDLDQGTPPYTFELKDLVHEIDRFGFIAGYTKRDFSHAQEAAANARAAKLMARLYEQLSKSGYEGHDASVLLTRLLFLMFGDDTGMWEKGLFEEFLTTRTSVDGSDMGGQLATLFQALNRSESRRPTNLDDLLRRFPHVNGGLFKDPIDIPHFDREMRNELLACSAFDWGAISPAIFGSMFQAVKSKEARRDLGEHYTTEQNIMRVIRPLFLDDLRSAFHDARDSKQRLENLRKRLARQRYLDPACGCGNFLVVAYRELRELELDILKRLRELDPQKSQLSLDPTLGLQVSLDQFFGIEIEEWPARIAETAMFLVDHQANLKLAQEFGQAPDRLPIEIAATIVIANAIDLDWGSLLPASDDVLIFGNPPFIGMSRMSKEQQADNRSAFQLVDAKGLRTGRLDYVACWYAKAIAYVGDTKARTAFVSTNSLTQGEQARTMHPLLLDRAGHVINFAHRTFKWTSEAANAAVVHVVVVGFSKPQSLKRRLFDYPTLTSEPHEANPSERINFYLFAHDGDIPGKRKAPLVAGLPNASKGSQPTDGGHLLVGPDEYRAVIEDPIAAKYLRPFRQSTEMLYEKPRWCLWLVDATPGDLHNSPLLRERLRLVAESRRKSNTASVAEQAKSPAIFTQIRQPAGRYLALPEVSALDRDYIPGRFYDSEIIAGNKLICWPDPPMWLFGYLQSSVFSAWVKAFAGRMKSDPSLAPSTTYFTFPFIVPTHDERLRIESAAQEVLDARDAHPGATLAALYDPLAMPRRLRRAHDALDQQIDRLYRGKYPTYDSRVRRLLTEYNSLTAPLVAQPRRRR
jgi:hypothetical protein